MNALVKLLQGNGRSIRQEAKELGISHAHLAKLIRGESPITWEFAAKVAQVKGLTPLTAFEMAGLLPLSEGQRQAVVEVVNGD